MDKLFGGNKGPSAAEIAMQRDRYVAANRADAEAEQRLAAVQRVSSLRKTLAYRDDNKKQTLA